MRYVLFSLATIAISAVLLMHAGSVYAASAYYVATNGNDSWDGLAPAWNGTDGPFATLARAQTAMENSSIKTTYIRAGTYRPAGIDIGGGDMVAVLLTSQDSGETWSYYSPDGIDTAIIDGGASSATTGLNRGFYISSANNVTINGLQIQNFKREMIEANAGGYSASTGSTGTIIENNVIHDNYDPSSSAGIAIWEAAQNSIIENNYVYNMQNRGIHALTCSGGCAGGLDGVVIKNNFVFNTCLQVNDCGAIYLQDYSSPRSTGIVIQNNFIRDTYLSDDSGGRGIYLDDGTSNVTVTGNIVSGHKNTCFNIHAGANDVYSGNICDEQSSGNESIARYETSGLASMGTGNAFTHNIIIAGSTGGGYGYAGDGTTQPATINDNAYYNYVGTSVNSSGSGGAGSDTNPTYENPQLSTWCYAIASGSPVYSSPVSFPGIVGGWGPIGFTIPSIGTAPSSPHSTGCANSSDTQAPSVPTGLTASAVSTSQINLSWTASTDNVGVTGYKIYRGGTQIATASGTTYSNTGLAAGTTYTYTVAAYDAAGNTSAQSSPASATTQSNPAPTVSLSASPTSITSGQSSTLTWSSTNATSCTGSGFSASGTSGSVTVTPSQTTTYSISCTGAGGSASASATVSVSSLTPSFGVGATVTAIANLNVRSKANLHGTLLCTVPAGTTGVIVGGPSSVQGYTWWDIDWNYTAGCDGWSVQDYLSLTSGGTTSSGGGTAGFTVGERVQTTDNLNIRSKAGTGKGSKILCVQPTGALGTIAGGPQVADGYTWWDVTFDTSCSGWAAESYLAPATTALAPATGTTAAITSSLAQGSSGPEVSLLQTALKKLGYFTDGTTGYFGSLTAAAVVQFQAANGIDQVGVVGPQTRAALNNKGF